MNVDDAIKKHDDYIDRRDNIKELLSKLSHVTNLADFLDETALFQGNDAMTKTEKVSCLTLHLAKGLEFSVVFIPGFEQDIMPLKNSESLEEERRLAYVGITRGKNHVVLLSSYKRTLIGNDWYHSPSQFIQKNWAKQFKLKSQSTHTKSEKHWCSS